MSNTELREWVRKELMANDSDELGENKERVKKFVRLTGEGNVMMNNRSLNKRLQVGLYFVGAAYAQAAGLRQEDTVTNKEVTERLGLPEGTAHPKIKELRDAHLIESIKDGVHRINYARIGDLLDEAEQAGGN